MTRPIALVCMMILAASPALAADGAASETSIVEAWQNAPDAVFEAKAIDLAALKWVARPLVVLADTPDDPAFNIGGFWHADVTCRARPHKAALLYAAAAPSRGGDTMFANQYLALESPPDG